MWAGYRSARVLRDHRGSCNKQKRRVRLAYRMRSLVALLLAAACAIARPPGHEPTPAPLPGRSSPYRRPVPPPSAREYVGDFFYDRFMFPHYRDDMPQEPIVPETDWLSKEIDRINQMQDEEESGLGYDADSAKWIAREPYLQRILANTKSRVQDIPYNLQTTNPNPHSHLSPPEALIAPEFFGESESIEQQDNRDRLNNPQPKKNNNSNFALTPLDKGYYDVDTNSKGQPPLPRQEHVMHEGEDPHTAMLLEPPRQIRQNPLSKSKTLVAENLERLRSGLAPEQRHRRMQTGASKDYRLPVSLLPTNLRWLKIKHPSDDDDDTRSHEDGHSTEKPRHVHVLETHNDPSESIYGVALVAAIGAAITMAVFGFAIGWYTLFKRAKAAADVDYPAYGVTGPTMDSSGDRKLAHSAHMYHYQHQKQQIIAMERNGMEQRNGSVSDPESEEDNEEGDYTVYECPGFATTGEMEVKNPLFTDDPTPATPGKCEVVKPQPKD